ncbi:MAG: nucleotidyltransferase family protein [Hyphomicrobiaceae bacterium]|nr:nucleotidyltransferase family protein [Hyphomicrobiaceae bacterium]
MTHARKSAAVWGVLLAAGTSSRFGDENKLLVEIDGVPLVRRVAERVVASSLAATVVVTGFESERVEDALSDMKLEFARNPDFRSGMAASLACGVAVVDGDASGAMIVLGDMPGVTTGLVDRLVGAFENEDCHKITYPAGTDGRQGNPVIWPRRFFPDLLSLTGDRGAKALIAANPDDTLAVSVDDGVAFEDIDTRSDLSE